MTTGPGYGRIQLISAGTDKNNTNKEYLMSKSTTLAILVATALLGSLPQIAWPAYALCIMHGVGPQ